MPPQVQLVPGQKYDVIHFIRESFIKDHQPDAYFEISDPWLASLPKGDTMGPESQPYHPWQDMDYGNWLIHCYELADRDDSTKNDIRWPCASTKRRLLIGQFCL